MGNYVLSNKADDDIIQIARDSIKTWGFARSEHYILGLHEIFERLAEFPDMGRNASHIRAGYLQMESGRHVIFYCKVDTGILIVRVLHDRMDFVRHL